MPSETRHLIELSDILELKIKCLTCHSAFYLTEPMDINPQATARCPRCGHSWLGEGHRDYVKEFSDSLKVLRDLAPRMQYLVSFQIPKEEAPIVLRVVSEKVGEKPTS